VRGSRLCKFLDICFHRRETLLVLDEFINFISQSRQIIAPDRTAFFEKIIGIAFFLSGNRIDYHENQIFRHCLASRQSAGFADD
jgi:hypothetical protein